MAEHHDKKDPIEEFFQKKAEDYDISYNEGDWLNLEKRLDLVDKQHAHRKRQHWIVAASVLIFSLLAYFTYENHLKINQISQKLNKQAVPGVQQDAEIKSGMDDPADTEENHDNNTVNTDDSNQENQGTPLLPSHKKQVEQHKNPDSNQEEEVAGKGNQLSTPISTSGRVLFVSELSCPACTISGSTTSKEDPLALSGVRASETEGDNPHLFASANNDPSASVDARKQGPRHTPRAGLSLVMGPDLSTVGSFSNFYDPGYKIGVAIEYRLSPNLSLLTGVIQSEVRYLAHGQEYKPPSGYWNRGVIPNETIGECILLDIPVSLKYSFMHFYQSRFYATAGLSSYIMLNENYRFNYDRDDTGLEQSWSGETGTRHWMSNVGFSIGYELDFHTNWSIRAEPFVKVPLKEVGWGKVKLYSVGSFVSINYKL